jgi:small subunit ribosomal protein S1
MAEPMDKPKHESVPSAPPTPETRERHAMPHRDDELDEEMRQALNAAANAQAPPPEVPLKRQWDAEIEAELEAALAGFDPKSIAGSRPRPKTGEKGTTAGGNRERGQDSRKGPRKGKVIGARGKSLFIDLGGKSEGVIPLSQFEGEIPMAGTEIEVVFDHYDASEGIQHLRLKGAAIEANWTNLHEGVIVEARVTKSVKGGVEVDVDGIRGFMPISQMDIIRVEDVHPYLNQKYKAVVTEANPREKNLVVSRRELLERERAELREKTWASLEEGQIREGTIRSIKDFGAFVDLGGVDGLLPIGEMSWSRVQKVEDLVKVGDRVKVKVIKIDPNARKLTLGLKQLQPSPWDTAEQSFPRGLMVKGKVTKLMEFGAFVELVPGVEGLIHITELSPTRVRRIADIVQPGQEVEVRVLKVEPDLKRIALSLLPAKGSEAAAEEVEEDDGTPPPPKPERKVPLKGGLGDRDQRRF